MNREKFSEKIKHYSRIIFKGEEVEIDQYSKTLKKWYRTKVVADGEERIFLWYFDITPEKVLLTHSKDIFNSVKIEHQTITERALQIAGCSFALFCVFNKTEKSFNSVNTAYFEPQFNELSQYLNHHSHKIPKALITMNNDKGYHLLRDIDPYSINHELGDILKGFLHYQIKVQPIIVEKNLVGTFVLLFNPDQKKINETMIANYAEQIGLYLTSERRKNTRWKLKKIFKRKKKNITNSVLI